MSLFRYLDLMLVALALPIFIAAGLPIAGWGVGAGAWVLQRGVQIYLERRAEGSKDPRTVVGLLAGSMIGRGWLVALAVLLVGLGDRHAGLAAAVLVIALFTVYFMTKMVLRPFDAAGADGSTPTGTTARGSAPIGGVTPSGRGTGTITGGRSGR